MRVWQAHDPSIARVPVFLGSGHAELFVVPWQQLIPTRQDALQVLCVVLAPKQTVIRT